MNTLIQAQAEINIYYRYIDVQVYCTKLCYLKLTKLKSGSSARIESDVARLKVAGEVRSEKNSLSRKNWYTYLETKSEYFPRKNDDSKSGVQYWTTEQ